MKKNMGTIWQGFMEGIIEYGMSAYDPLGIWKYPLIFVGVFGFIYGWMQSVTVTVVAIIFTFAIYGVTTNIFANVPDLTLFLYIITLMGIALLITVLFIKRR